MSKELMTPETFLTKKYGIDSHSVEKAMTGFLRGKVDYADLYFEYVLHDALGLEEGLVKTASRNIAHGVGVRAIAGENRVCILRRNLLRSDTTRCKDSQLHCIRVRK